MIDAIKLVSLFFFASIACCGQTTQSDAVKRQAKAKPNPWEISKTISADDLKALEGRVEREEADAQFELGLRYRSGYGVPVDSLKAWALIAKAADKGHSVAQVEMATIYRNGYGVKKDLAKSIEYLRRAADQGDGFALVSLGSAYKDGEVVEKDLEKAEELYWKADSPFARSLLMSLAEDYFGVLQNTNKAVAIHQKLAEKGWVLSQSRLGFIHYDRARESFNRTEIAALVAGKTWEQANREATKNPETSQDFAEAAKWFRKAAEQAYVSAEGVLGELYLNGQGVSEDHHEAVKWLRKAANHGDFNGQVSLGQCYEIGKGVAQDFVEVHKWYNLAAAQDAPSNFPGIYKFIYQLRDALGAKMTPEQIAEAQRRASAFVATQESSAGGPAKETDAMPGEASMLKATGSGFFISEDGCLLTSYHVVENAGRITLKTKEGEFAAKLVKADKANDVALLKAVGEFAAIPVAPSRGVKLGESVFTIGFPNIELQGFAPKLTKGEISSSTGAHDDPREFQISVAVQPGNSGGPLVDRHGNVVGIAEARLSDIATLKSTGSLPQNVNYAVKSSVLNVLLESLPDVSANLKQPNLTKDRHFEDVVREAEAATALVLVY